MIFPDGFFERFTREHPVQARLVLLFGVVMFGAVAYLLSRP